jgi:hypothetical protein
MHIGVLGAIRVSSAKRLGLESQIEKVTGLPAATISRRLGDAHGATLLESLFEDDWFFVDELMELSELSEMTVASARDDETVMDNLRLVTGLTLRTIRKRFADTHGATKLSTCFAKEWPGPAHAELIGESTAAAVIGYGLCDEIATITGLNRSSVRRTLKKAHGNANLASTFARSWPTPGSDSSRRPTPSARTVRTKNPSVTTPVLELSEDLAWHLANAPESEIKLPKRIRLEPTSFSLWPTS